MTDYAWSTLPAIYRTVGSYPWYIYADPNQIDDWRKQLSIDFLTDPPLDKFIHIARVMGTVGLLSTAFLISPSEVVRAGVRLAKYATLLRGSPVTLMIASNAMELQTTYRYGTPPADRALNLDVVRTTIDGTEYLDPRFDAATRSRLRSIWYPDGDYSDDMISYGTLGKLQATLDEANDATALEAPISGVDPIRISWILFDFEKFRTDIAGAPEDWNAAILQDLNWHYDITTSVLPNVQIDHFCRGAARQEGTRTYYDPFYLLTEDEKGDAFCAGLYSPDDPNSVAANANLTLLNAVAHPTTPGSSRVNAWLYLGGHEKHTYNGYEAYDYPTALSYQYGRDFAGDTTYNRLSELNVMFFYPYILEEHATGATNYEGHLYNFLAGMAAVEAEQAAERAVTLSRVQFTLHRDRATSLDTRDYLSYQLRVRCTYNAIGTLPFLSNKIFVYQRSVLYDPTQAAEDGSTLGASPSPSRWDTFVGVASIQDLQAYAEDTPSAGTSLFRSSVVDMVFRDTALMEETWETLCRDVNALRIQLEAYRDIYVEDSLETENVTCFTGSSSSSGTAGYVLTRSAIATYPVAAPTGWRMTVTCAGRGGWDSCVFRHLRQTKNVLTGEILERPMGVCTPADLEEYPADAPDDLHFPRFYRKSTMDVFSENLDYLIEAWGFAIQEIHELWRTMRAMDHTPTLDSTPVGSEIWVSGSSSSYQL